MDRIPRLATTVRGVGGDRRIFDTVTVAATTVRTPIGDPETAVRRTRSAIQSLDHSVRLVVTQEIATGYEKERGYHLPGLFDREWGLMMQHIAPLSAGRLIVYGIPIHYNGAPYNGAVFLWDGAPIAATAKMYLAQGGEYEDTRYFTALKPGFFDPHGLNVQGHSIPFGDLVVGIGGVRVKALVCEDLWVEGGPAASALEHGVDIIGWLNASHEAVGRHQNRIQLINARSLCSSTAIVGSASLGVQAGHHVFGGGNLISQGGNILAAGERFLLREWGTTSATVDLHLTRQSRLMSTSQRTQPARANVVTAEGTLYSGELPSSPLSTPELLTELDGDEEAISIITSWIWDQFVGSRQDGFLVLNSGGSDSRLTLMLAKLAIVRAWNQLGTAEFKRVLAHVKGIEEVQSPDQFFAQHAYGPYLTGRTSGEKTALSARVLSEALGFQFVSGSIVEIESALNGAAARILGLEGLSWDSLPGGVDTTRLERTLENAPVRARGGLGWQIANALHLLYLTTSNLDEVWAKYYSLGGDVEGAGAPLAGSGKLRIERMNVRVARELGIYAQIQEFLKMAPTAEIKPAAMAQTDDGELGLLVYRTRARELLVGEDRDAVQTLLCLAREFTPEGCSVGEAEELWTDLAFALVKLLIPTFTTQWARMQLAISPVVEPGPQHPGESESNRRPAVDLSYRPMLVELVQYLAHEAPRVLVSLLKRSGMGELQRIVDQELTDR